MEEKITRENVCRIHGHDARWRLIHGPMPKGERRKAVLICLDCHKIFKGNS
jgi:hypothetical protein